MPILRVLLVVMLGLVGLRAQAPRLDYYLADVASYDAAIPRPAEVLGHEVGEWHLRPDQIDAYLRLLGERSERVRYRLYGRTHERRPLSLLEISAPKNLARIDEIRADRRALFDPALEAPDCRSMPLVAWMGYSVHGDESSGASAALLLAYHLAAAPLEVVGPLLDESLILLDPCLNPDGLARFAIWANANRGARINDDPRHREHRQPWPGGRTNHYWFDLNRDWLLARQPESRARLEIFQAWRPNLVTDFHEMGSGSTYFFQPGVPSRMNPLIPARNFELTAAIAEENARALDAIDSLYYTQETFDDFYFGKGSTYPDVHGGVGILFEQASSRGHAQKTSFGRIDFPFTIRNQLTCSLASLEAARSRRAELLDYQREFYVSAAEAAAADPIRAWVFDSPEDPRRAEALAALLLRHDIVVHRLGAAVGSENLAVGRAFIVPTDQPQYRLIKSLFERRREFADPVFYDVSTWNLFASHDLEALEIGGESWAKDQLGERVLSVPRANGGIFALPEGRAPRAFLCAWNAASSAAFLVRVQDEGLRVMASSEPLTIDRPDGSREFGRGALCIPVGIQARDAETVRSIVATAAEATGVEVVEVASALTALGVDLGSPSLAVLEPLKLLMVVGSGVSAYEAGHVWHQLDRELGVRLTMVDSEAFSAAMLADYGHLIAVGGCETALQREKEGLLRWIKAGGALVAQRSAARWAAKELLGLEVPKEKDGEKAPEAANYADLERVRAENRVSGAIFTAKVDLSHPLAWGLARPEIALWRSGTELMAAPKNHLDAVLRYREEPLPLLSGFASERNQKRLAGSAAAAVERLGSGVVVRFADAPTFRGFWPGSARLLVNALVMAPLARGTDGGEDEEAH